MWEAVVSYINSPNAISLTICIAVVVFVLVKFRVMKIKTTHVSIGNDDERDIIRQQTEYAHAYVMSKINELDFAVEDSYHIKYVLECLYDDIVNWIMFNHFSLDNAYIVVKSNALYAKICTLTTYKEVTTDAFRQKVNSWVYDLVKQLIEIRELHK